MDNHLQTLTKPVAIDARLISGQNTGDSTYWTGLVHGLKEVAPTAPLLFISNTPRPQEIPWSQDWQWKVVPGRSSRFWSLVSFPLAARRLGAGAIHVQYNLSPLAGERGITTVHDVSFFVGPQWFTAKDRLLLQTFVPRSIRRSARVIAVSETSSQEIQKFVPAARGKTSVTLLAAAPWIKSVPLPAARATILEAFGVEGPFLLTVGTRWARKNQELALAVAEALPDDLPHKLLVAGKNGSAGGDRSRALGYVTEAELCALYSAADAFLFPSQHEGFGIPVLEAFACGCPVICGDKGALSEVAGGAAMIPKEYSVEGWVSELTSELRESSNLDRFRQAGYRRAKAFSWARTAGETLKIYQETVQL